MNVTFDLNLGIEIFFKLLEFPSERNCLSNSSSNNFNSTVGNSFKN